VLSLPETLPDGAALPGRDLAIFIASGVILVSLVVGVIALPLLLRGWRRGKDPHAAEEALARTMAAQAAIRAVDDLHDKECANLDESASAYAADVTARVMDIYRRRLTALAGDQEPRDMARRADALEFRMKLSAMRAERQVLLSLRSNQTINDETFNKLMHEVDLSETALTARWK
jgi:CPA1 family monovalent cation:H+ antiporter